MGKDAQYFTTGELARLCGVTKHTLFHYDALGIFSPAQVDPENGYRRYAVSQVDVFAVIRTLRELGMPLGEIQDYLRRRSPGELVRLLEREDRLLGEKIAHLERMRRRIRQRAELTRRAMAAPLDAVTAHTEARALLALTPVRALSSDRSAAVALAAHMRMLEENGLESPYPIGSMIGQKAARAGDADGYSHFYTQLPEDTAPAGAVLPQDGASALTLFERPAGEYLAACHTGGYETVWEAYERIFDYAEREGKTLSGSFYEDTLLDELSAKGYDQYVLRISILTV